VELEEQVAALRSELAQLREQLAAATEARDAAVRSTATDVVQVDDEDRPASPVGEGTPRWGRRSNEGAQAIRTTRSSRRRWWLPFF
jgi:hypothetical protein